MLLGKLTKRDVDVRALEFGEIEKMSGDKVKQVVTVRVGVEQELAKKIVRLIKDSKLKVQASIQGDAVRVSGAKRDDLQAAIALVKKIGHRLSAAVRQLPGLGPAAKPCCPNASSHRPSCCAVSWPAMRRACSFSPASARSPRRRR